MTDRAPSAEREELKAQRNHWEANFATRPEMFGVGESHAARRAAEQFHQDRVANLLELGAGQGRDTLFFANQGLRICALDYSAGALAIVRRKAASTGLSDPVETVCHDVTLPLPFSGDTFDACYAHMLYCMALSSAEIHALAQEVRRVLKPGGPSIYTVRHTGDPHYRKGLHRGEDLWEMGGFIVHFFTREKVHSLASGYELLGVEEFEEGGLPRQLFLVIQRKAQS